MAAETLAATRPGPADGRPHRPVPAVVVLLTAILTVLLIAFAWPAARSEPRDLPVGVAGPAPAVAQVTGALEQNVPGGFEVHSYADRAAAVAAIEDRDVYGAVVTGPSGPEVLTASAASYTVSQVLTQVAGRIAGQTGTAPKVTDVVAAPADDPRGAGLAAGALPLVLGGIITAGALVNLVGPGARRIAGAFAVAVAGGLALTAVLQYWLGSVDGDYWANSAVVALSIAAISVTILGLEWLMGVPGLALGAATMMLLGNPLSGLASAPEMLPAGWGDLGQLLPPGATGTALRSVAFFDGAGATGPLSVLTAWLLFGLLLSGVAAVTRRSPTKPRPAADAAAGSRAT